MCALEVLFVFVLNLAGFSGKDITVQQRPMHSDHDTEAEHVLLTEEKKWYKDGNNIRLLIMVGLTALFMIVELAFGFVTDSLALISDAFHMLSDVVSLIVGISARLVRIFVFHRING